MKSYNFNEHIVAKPINRFGGSERKETVILDDGHEYLMKLPDPTRELGRPLSYINNAISEYIGCKIVKEVGLSVQEVILGDYTTMSSHGSKSYVACACRNLEHDGLRLAEAERTSLVSDQDTKSASNPSFDTLETIAKYTPGISLEEIKSFYAEMFVADSFIGNKDRHNGNWGFLSNGLVNIISPIYDCGSSLCPLYEDSELTDKTAVREAMTGVSAIRDENGNKINYSEYLSSCRNADVNAALKRIVPRIDMNRITEMIRETPYISEVRKNFYILFLETKYCQVLIPALEKLFELENNITYEAPDVSGDYLYSFYKSNLSMLNDIPVYGTVAFSINGIEKAATRVDSARYLVFDPHTHLAEAVISGRSQNKKVWKTMQVISQTYEISTSSMKLEVGQEKKYTTYGTKIVQAQNALRSRGPKL